MGYFLFCNMVPFNLFLHKYYHFPILFFELYLKMYHDYQIIILIQIIIFFLNFLYYFHSIQSFYSIISFSNSIFLKSKIMQVKVYKNFLEFLFINDQYQEQRNLSLFFPRKYWHLLKVLRVLYILNYLYFKLCFQSSDLIHNYDWLRILNFLKELNVLGLESYIGFLNTKYPPI